MTRQTAHSPTPDHSLPGDNHAHATPHHPDPLPAAGRLRRWWLRLTRADGGLAEPGGPGCSAGTCAYPACGCATRIRAASADAESPAGCNPGPTADDRTQSGTSPQPDPDRVSCTRCGGSQPRCGNANTCTGCGISGSVGGPLVRDSGPVRAGQIHDHGARSAMDDAAGRVGWSGAVLALWHRWVGLPASQPLDHARDRPGWGDRGERRLRHPGRRVGLLGRDRLARRVVIDEPDVGPGARHRIRIRGWPTHRSGNGAAQPAGRLDALSARLGRAAPAVALAILAGCATQPEPATLPAVEVSAVPQAAAPAAADVRIRETVTPVVTPIWLSEHSGETRGYVYDLTAYGLGRCLVVNGGVWCSAVEAARGER